MKKCPHCLVSIYVEISITYLGKDVEGEWGILEAKCPHCGKYIFYLIKGKNIQARSPLINNRFLIHPKGSNRPPAPSEVSSNIAEDYKEACLVLPDSPKASAALSRRCLQNLLREEAGVSHNNLANEIQQVIDSEKLPPYISEAIDAIRNIGNFSAHPIKSESTGEIVSVEEGEAEWILDVLESLFEFYYVQKKKLKERKNKLNKKLKDAGKKEMKEPNNPQ
ncbi:MAG: DUF4145 domain-containing protein [Bacteroidales bacterium]|jgi:hypothetical protein|nr:DUF4145 domain-containing protein [Bacteroidales bacterium]